MLAFLADMPVPQSAVKMAQDLGYDARHVREYGMRRATDPAILQRAAVEKRIILTMDLGFSRDVAVTGVECHGLIVFRLGNVTADEVTLAFRRVLTGFSEEEIAGYIIVVEPGRIRRRALPLRVDE
mgnify:CR=1 FL=1